MKNTATMVRRQMGVHHWHRRPRTFRRLDGLFDLKSSSERTNATMASSYYYDSEIFWKDLNQAARQGDGMRAEKIVDQVMQEYKQQRQQSNLSPYGTDMNKLDASLLDTRIFSLVLQAWNNSESPSLYSALRAQNLLEQVLRLSEKGLLSDKPTLQDYQTVLESWEKVSSTFTDNNDKDSNIAVVVQNATTVWNRIKEEASSSTSMASLDKDCYEAFLSILAKAGRGSDAEQVIEEALQILSSRVPGMSSPKSETIISMEWCMSVLQAHIQSLEPERADAFLKKMLENPFMPKPDVAAYNSVLTCWMTSQRHHQDYALTAPDRVEDLLSEMKQARIQPNLASYSIAIGCLARIGEGRRAETLLTKLIKDYSLQFDKDLKPSIEPFQSVLWAYSNSSHPNAANRAESVLKTMKELSSASFDTFPTVLDYKIVMTCWSRSKSPASVERTRALYSEMLDLPSINEGLVGDEEQSSTNHVSATLRPDVVAMNIVLNASSYHEKAYQTEKLLWEFYDRHRQDPIRNPHPDTIAFSTVINAWSKSRDMDAPARAERLLQKLDELYMAGNAACKPDLITYTCLINCWSKSKRSEAPQRAESLLRRLQRMAQNGDIDMKPDTACWNSVIASWALAGNGEHSEALFMEMVDTHRKNPTTASSPNEMTLTHVLSAWKKTRSREASDRALALLDRMEQLHKDGILNVKPNVVSYSVVMDCLVYARKRSTAERAESLLRKMAASDDPNLKPNVISYNSVIKAWSFTSDSMAVSKVMELMIELIDQSEESSNMRPNANTFGHVFKALANSNLPNRAKQAETVEKLMSKFNCEHTEWSRNEFERCNY